MNLKLKLAPGVYLLGFMGSGKSTIGRHLADRLGWSFFDTDREIEAAEKSALADLLEARGEAEFRRIETEILREHVHSIERGRPAVVALGAGAFMAPENRDMLSQHGMTVWIHCPFEVIQRRFAEAARRSSAFDSEKLAGVYTRFLESYRLADIHIPIESDDPLHTVETILAHPLLK